MIVTASSLNVRSGPGEHFRVLRELSRGTEVEVKELATGDWSWVTPGEGWVAGRFLAEGGFSAAPQEPAWMTVARKEKGVSEVVGSAHNPRILEYHATTSLKATNDETAWCSAFVCWCLEAVGVKSTRSAAALSFARWGRVLEKPTVGCIVVLRRGSHSLDMYRKAIKEGTPLTAHVGFYVGSEGERVKILGGNQGNHVSEALFKKSDVLGYRMPE